MIRQIQHSHPILKRQPPPKREKPKVIVRSDPVPEKPLVRRKRVGCCG